MSKVGSKRENSWISPLVNIVIPVCVLSFLSKDERLGPLWSLVVAVAFPVAYGLKTLLRERKADVLAIIGLVSVLLTGVIGIQNLSKEWIAVKEGGVPLLVGLLIVGSLKTPFPLIKKLMLSEALFDLDRLWGALREKGNVAHFEKRLVGLTWGFASAMFVSSVLNYVLAKLMLQSEEGTAEYTAELGRMMGLSHVVILVPVMVIMVFVFNALFKAITELTGLEVEEVLAAQHRKEADKEKTLSSSEVE
ncbi:MAG: hypothetical protein JXR40_04810 [Pontiellaceae bacterium]|nr:hypothetical protein [Pontiellaceae bacterium]